MPLQSGDSGGAFCCLFHCSVSQLLSKNSRSLPCFRRSHELSAGAGFGCWSILSVFVKSAKSSKKEEQYGEIIEGNDGHSGARRL